MVIIIIIIAIVIWKTNWEVAVIIVYVTFIVYRYMFYVAVDL